MLCNDSWSLQAFKSYTRKSPVHLSAKEIKMLYNNIESTDVVIDNTLSISEQLHKANSTCLDSLRIAASCCDLKHKFVPKGPDLKKHIKSENLSHYASLKDTYECLDIPFLFALKQQCNRIRHMLAEIRTNHWISVIQIHTSIMTCPVFKPSFHDWILSNMYPLPLDVFVIKSSPWHQTLEFLENYVLQYMKFVKVIRRIKSTQRFLDDSKQYNRLVHSSLRKPTSRLSLSVFIPEGSFTISSAVRKRINKKQTISTILFEPSTNIQFEQQHLCKYKDQFFKPFLMDSQLEIPAALNLSPGVHNIQYGVKTTHPDKVLFFIRRLETSMECSIPANI
jgi:hypothetical protein